MDDGGEGRVRNGSLNDQAEHVDSVEVHGGINAREKKPVPAENASARVDEFEIGGGSSMNGVTLLISATIVMMDRLVQELVARH